MKYVALLRGINVGGNNKVPMSDLKMVFEKIGMKQVSTYINSGNVLFETSEQDEAKLVHICESEIEQTFGFAVKVAIISKDEIAEAWKHRPSWWGNSPEIKHDALITIAPTTAEDVVKEMGEATEYEQVAYWGKVIFWSAPIKTYGRTRYSKIVGSKLYKKITIRNANTMRKLQALLDSNNE